MSKYGELLALVDYVANNKKEKKSTRWHREENDPMTNLIKLKRTVDEFGKFQKDLEKINKKEGDDSWSKMSFLQKFIVLTALTPVMVCFQFVLPAIIIIKILGLHQ